MNPVVLLDTSGFAPACSLSGLIMRSSLSHVAKLAYGTLCVAPRGQDGAILAAAVLARSGAFTKKEASDAVKELVKAGLVVKDRTKAWLVATPEIAQSLMRLSHPWASAPVPVPVPVPEPEPEPEPETLPVVSTLMDNLMSCESIRSVANLLKGIGVPPSTSGPDWKAYAAAVIVSKYPWRLGPSGFVKGRTVKRVIKALEDDPSGGKAVVNGVLAYAKLFDTASDKEERRYVLSIDRFFERDVWQDMAVQPKSKTMGAYERIKRLREEHSCKN